MVKLSVISYKQFIMVLVRNIRELDEGIPSFIKLCHWQIQASHMRAEVLFHWILQNFDINNNMQNIFLSWLIMSITFINNACPNKLFIVQNNVQSNWGRSFVMELITYLRRHMIFNIYGVENRDWSKKISAFCPP